MRKAYVESFNVSGICVRTQNIDEQDISTSKITNLWNDFYAKNIYNTIKDKPKNSLIYGVYSNYKTDFNDEFDVIAGIHTTKEVPSYKNIKIKSGEYLVFKKDGEIPQIVIKLWQEIWNYFETSEEKRAYTTDFEKYINKNELEIYISIL